MTFPRKHIACFGRDLMLLQTRRLLLEQAGYAPLITSNPHTAAEWLLRDDVSVLVLCHTISKSDVDVIFKVHQETESSALILCLSVGEWTSALDCRKVYDAQKGPAAFLAEVGKLNMYQTSLAGSIASLG